MAGAEHQNINFMSQSIAIRPYMCSLYAYNLLFSCNVGIQAAPLVAMWARLKQRLPNGDRQRH